MRLTPRSVAVTLGAAAVLGLVAAAALASGPETRPSLGDPVDFRPPLTAPPTAGAPSPADDPPPSGTGGAVPVAPSPQEVDRPRGGDDGSAQDDPGLRDDRDEDDRDDPDDEDEQDGDDD